MLWHGQVAGCEAIVRRRFRADWPRVGATLMDMMDGSRGIEWRVGKGLVKREGV